MSDDIETVRNLLRHGRANGDAPFSAAGWDKALAALARLEARLHAAEEERDAGLNVMGVLEQKLHAAEQERDKLDNELGLWQQGDSEIHNRLAEAEGDRDRYEKLALDALNDRERLLAERLALEAELDKLRADERMWHNAANHHAHTVDRLREALDWLVKSRPYPSAECWAQADAALSTEEEKDA